MPIHDWTRVDAAVFHSLRILGWIGTLKKPLNDGLLPPGITMPSRNKTPKRPNWKSPVYQEWMVAIRHDEEPPHDFALIKIISPDNKSNRHDNAFIPR